ncbi:MAG: hypothetical protein ACK5WZ_11290 [Pseudobdellovibrionaceae bacterium]
MDHTPACLTNRNSAAPGLARIEAQFGDLVRYGETMRNQGRIRTECIAAAMTRSIPQQGFICQSPESKTPKLITPGVTEREIANKGPCITPELVDHVTFLTNQALACMGELNQPINPEIVFRKINNESGFHFYKAYGGGVGLGQLTSIANRQVLSGTTPIYETFKKNTGPACQIFKRPVMDMERRLEKRATQGPARTTARAVTPSSRANTAGPNSPQAADLERGTWCNLISSSDGLAANAIVSMLYFAHTRANIVNSTVRPVLAENGFSDVRSQQRFIDLVTLGAFGRDGNNAPRMLLEPLRESLKTSNPREEGFEDRAYAEFSKGAATRITYLKEIQEKANLFKEQIPVFNGISHRNFSAPSTADCVEPPVAVR